MKVIHTILGRVREVPPSTLPEGWRSVVVESNEEVPGGIYFGHVVAGRQKLPSVIFAGTIANSDQNLAEALLWDFEKELGRQELRLELAHKIREHRLHASELEQSRQLEVDLEIARVYFDL